MNPSRPAPSTLAIACALGTLYLVWGSTYLAIAYVVETIPPFLGAGIRFALAGLLLLGFLVIRDRWRRRRVDRAGLLERPGWPEWRSAIIVGTLLLLGGNGMVMVAEQTVDSGIAAVMIATIPIWLTLFDALITRRAPSRLAIGGLVVGLAGVAILLWPSGGVDALDPVGIGILLFASLSWAAGSLYARQAPLPRNGLLGSGMEQLTGGAVILLVSLALAEPARLDPATVSTESVLGLAFLVVFGSVLAFSAYVWLLDNVAVTTVATYAYVNPIVAVALGIFIRGESLSPRALLAAVLIIGAVVAMVSGRPRPAEDRGSAPARPGSPGRALASDSPD
jgi:drug/metabolite transporter (DMT)-like permease